MATLDEILEMWETDSQIDDNHLDQSSSNSPKLHSKYIRLLAEAKLKYTKLNIDYATLRKNKFRYYRGEMSREELFELGWNQWQGNKPIKSEMDEFLKGDIDLMKIQSRIDYLKIMIETLESIMTEIRNRAWTIKNSIAWKQFLAGG